MKRTPQPGDVHRVHQFVCRQPPDGFPALLAEWVYTYADTSRPYPYMCQEERTLRDVLSSLGLLGVNTCVTTPSPPPKELPPEQRAKHRLRNLRRRMERKYPLFAEQFVDDEIARKPAYYRGERENEDAYQAVIRRWQEDYDRWQAKAKEKATS